MDPKGSVVTRGTTYRQSHVDNFHKLFTFEGQLAPNSNMIFLYGNNHNMIIEPFKNHSKVHCDSGNQRSAILPVSASVLTSRSLSREVSVKKMVHNLVSALTIRSLSLKIETDFLES